VPTFIVLFAAIVGIVLATTWLKLHPFLSLILAGILTGLAVGLGPDRVIAELTTGFGNTLKSIGIVIACGTIIGTFLERSGGAQTLAASVLRLVGSKKAPLAMSITGFIISVPVFCDSGYVILASLNKILSRRTGISLVVLAVALATGLYATHVFVPPTPGPLAAAATLNADIGLVILLGLVVSVPAVLAGLLWAMLYARRFHVIPDIVTEPAAEASPRPRLGMSLLPLLVPIVLISLRSIADYPTRPLGGGAVQSTLLFIGHPVVALLIGVLLSFALKSRQADGTYRDWVAAGLRNAGVIILITGAGGAFGNVLRATDIGDRIGTLLSDWNMGILLPFVIAAFLKTAQGSSTVAIITTSALVSPLLPSLGLTAPLARALTVLAIGAGSMTVSHVNDSYFWVVSQFSDMNTATALRCFTLATLLQGLCGMATIMLMAWLFI